MEGAYYFGEYLRWNLGFPNPNVGGAFAAMLIAFLLPLAAAGRGGGAFRPPFVLVLAAELVLWFLLVKTYSRGAFISACICLLLCNAALLFRGFPKREILSILSVKIFAIAAMALASGFFARISPGYLRDDGSAGARATLWRGGLAMVAQAPIEGWGSGQSGREYINWFQDLNDNREYAGMVNGYLLIAVERGLPALFAALFPFAFLIIAGMLSPFGRFPLPQCGAFGLLSYLISNFFSSLWVFGALWWVVIPLVLSAASFLFCAKAARIALKSAVCGLFACLIFCVLMFGAGLSLGGGGVRKLGGCVRLCSENTDRARRIALFPDEGALGKYFGKTVRRAAASLKNGVCIDVFANAANAEFSGAEEKYDVAVLCGTRALLLNSAGLRGAKIILINPVGIPNELASKPAHTYLPSLDYFNQNRVWLRRLEEHGLPYSLVEYSSQQISADELAKIIEAN